MSDSESASKLEDGNEIQSNDGKLGRAAQSTISVVLVIHLFCIAICFLSVLPTSDLGARLLSVFSPYLQFMHFDLDYTPIYLTRETLNNDTLGTYGEREFTIEYLPADGDETDPEAWVRVDEVISSWPGSRQRFARYATTSAFFVDDEGIVSRFVREVAKYLILQEKIDVAKVRIRQHRPVPRERYYVDISREIPDADASIYFSTRYTALVVVDENGVVDVLKDADRSETALIREGGP